jgi:hypothetical protein
MAVGSAAITIWGMLIVFTARQERAIWKAAMLAFKILRDQGRLTHPGSILLVWNAIAGDRELFPPSLIPDAETAVANRLDLISSRAHLGQRLCPELGH